MQCRVRFCLENGGLVRILLTFRNRTKQGDDDCQPMDANLSILTPTVAQACMNIAAAIGAIIGPLIIGALTRGDEKNGWRKFYVRWLMQNSNFHISRSKCGCFLCDVFLDLPFYYRFL